MLYCGPGAAGCPLLLIDVSCQNDSQQQTCCMPVLLSMMGETGGCLTVT